MSLREMMSWIFGLEWFFCTNDMKSLVFVFV